MKYLMIDIEGIDLNENDVRRIQHPHVGGVILFSRNYVNKSQLTQLIQTMREVKEELLIAVDYEGGRVQRFREEFTLLPSMRTLGNLFDDNESDALEMTEKIGWLIGQELGEVGIDFSFTPVLDIDYGSSSVIGDRSFHDRVTPVIDLSQALIKGLNRAGMSAVGKHFPGHGFIKADTHLEKAIDARSFDEIAQNDLQPFAQMIASKIEGIMPSHVIYSSCDPNPASMSSFWLNTVLRERLNFKGIIFSDDLSMQAAVDQEPNPAKRVFRAFNAGIDYALVCNNPRDVDLILDSMDSKKVIEKFSPKFNMRLDRSKHQCKTFHDQPLSYLSESILKMTHEI